MARHRSRLQAYNALQTRLMACYIRRGGTAEGWCEQYAAAFRQRFGWMLTTP
ncbi:MAG: hypothetical protein JO180_02700 [Gemmatirosa sp.]|nr:hypothetical protein [Gemmatirosa sp.]